jgi:hypothetical protein
MGCLTRWSWHLLATSVGFACGGSEAPEGPGVDGSPFLTATVDGVPWSPDPGVLDAYWNGKVVLRGSRNPANADTSEVLQIVFAPPNAFQLGSYRLRGDAEGAGQFVIWSGVSGEAPQVQAGYVTHAQHTGLITLTGASSTDSLVSGVFAFIGEDRLTHLLRHVRGEFRVRYSSIDP